METVSASLIGSLAGIVGAEHVLTGEAAAGYAVDWTGRFRGQAAAVVRPRDTAEVAAVLALCRDAGAPVVPQGGNTGLVGGAPWLHLARSEAERGLFARIRGALDPSGTLNPHVLPRLFAFTGRRGGSLQRCGAGALRRVQLGRPLPCPW